MKHRHIAVGFGFVLLSIGGIAIAGSFSDAERAADRFGDEVHAVEKLSLEATEKPVTVTCDAEVDTESSTYDAGEPAESGALGCTDGWCQGRCEDRGCLAGICMPRGACRCFAC